MYIVTVFYSMTNRWIKVQFARGESEFETYGEAFDKMKELENDNKKENKAVQRYRIDQE